MLCSLSARIERKFHFFALLQLPRKYQIMYKQNLKPCSVELTLPQQPRAIRVTIHCRHSNQATGLLVVFFADNNSQVDPQSLEQ